MSSPLAAGCDPQQTMSFNLRQLPTSPGGVCIIYVGVSVEFSASVSTRPGVVACTYNPATLEVDFRNGVGPIPVEGNSTSLGGWIV